MVLLNYERIIMQTTFETFICNMLLKNTNKNNFCLSILWSWDNLICSKIKSLHILITDKIQYMIKYTHTFIQSYSRAVAPKKWLEPWPNCRKQVHLSTYIQPQSSSVVFIFICCCLCCVRMTPIVPRKQSHFYWIQTKLNKIFSSKRLSWAMATEWPLLFYSLFVAKETNTKVFKQEWSPLCLS